MWFLLFSRSVPSPNMRVYVYYVIDVFVVCVLFCVVQKKGEGETGDVID